MNMAFLWGLKPIERGAEADGVHFSLSCRAAIGYDHGYDGRYRETRRPPVLLLSGWVEGDRGDLDCQVVDGKDILTWLDDDPDYFRYLRGI
jgi:hypothetical protein